VLLLLTLLVLVLVLVLVQGEGALGTALGWALGALLVQGQGRGMWPAHARNKGVLLVANFFEVQRGVPLHGFHGANPDTSTEVL